MTREELYRGIENIDEDLINDVDFSAKKRRSIKWFFVTAACLCIIIGVVAITNVNINTEVNATVSWEVIEQGEFYQISTIRRVFQSGLSKSESIQYNYVVYNGKFVLASGVSMKKPEVHQLNKNVICIEHSDYSQEYMTYCRLNTDDKDEVPAITIMRDDFLFEFEGKVVYISYYDEEREDPNVFIDRMNNTYAEYLELGQGTTDVSATLNDAQDKITVKYTNADGQEQTEQIKIKDTKNNKEKIVKNKTEIKCLWEEKLIEKTNYTYTYKIDCTINREKESVINDEEDDLYQCFIVANNKIIDEGCYIEAAPQFMLVEDDILAMKFGCDILNNYNECRFYKLSTGAISKAYLEPLFTVNGKVAEPTYDEERPDYLTFYDIFTGKKVDLSGYQLLDATVTKEGTVDIKYKTAENEAKSEQLKLLYPTHKGGLKESNIDNIAKMYEIENENYCYYLFFIYNKDGTEIVYYDYNMFYAEITKISDDILKISTSWGQATECLRYYNIETNTLSKQYTDVMAESNEMIVYLTFEDEDVCVNISDLYGTYNKKYVLDKKYTQGNKYFYEDMTLENDKLIIKMTYLADGDGEDEILEYPIK